MRKTIHGRYETNNPTEQQIRYGSEWFKDDKYLYVHENIITHIITHCKVSKPKSV